MMSGMPLSLYYHLRTIILTTVVLAGGCTDFKPLDLQRGDQMPEGPGILTGERGAFVIRAGGPVDTAAATPADPPPMTQPPPLTSPPANEAPAPLSAAPPVREQRLPVADALEPLDGPDAGPASPPSRKLRLPPLSLPLPPPQ